jgi:ribose transport system substrate-binding protein
MRLRTVGAVLAAASLAGAVAACGSDSGSGSASSGGSAVSAADVKPSIYCGTQCQADLKLKANPNEIKCKVGVSWNSAKHPYGAQTTQKTAAFAKQTFPNMQVFVTDGRGDGATQAGQVDDLLARGIDVLIVSPADAKALAGVVKRAEADGVKVIASDRQVDAPVTTYIGSDNVEAGDVVGKWLAQKFPNGAKVAELQGSLGASPTIDRHKGFDEAIAGSPVKVIAGNSGDYDRAQGLKVMEDYLQRFPKGQLDAVFAHNDEMALGAIQAIKEAGRTEITVTGVDGEGQALDLVKSGAYAATAGYPLTYREHTIAAAKLCAGESVPPRIKLDSTLITKENVAKYESNPPQ